MIPSTDNPPYVPTLQYKTSTTRVMVALLPAAALWFLIIRLIMRLARKVIDG